MNTRSMWMVVSIAVVFRSSGAAMPAEQDEAALRRGVRSQFAAQYREATSDSAKDSLAWTLLHNVRQSGLADSAQLGLLLEARDLMASVGNLSGAAKVVDRIAAIQGVSAISAQTDILRDAAKGLRFPEQHLIVIERVGELLPKALVARDFELALELQRIAVNSARRIGDRSLLQTINETTEEIKEAQEEAADVAAFEERLKESPNDSQAHQRVGRFMCLYLGDWAAGLTHLAAGDDDTWKSLAAQLQADLKSSERLRIAEQLIAEASESQGIVQRQIIEKARSLIRSAVADLAGPETSRAEAVIDQMETLTGQSRRNEDAITPEKALELFGLDPNTWKASDGVLSGVVTNTNGDVAKMLTPRPLASMPFRFSFKIKAKWYHVIMVHHAGTSYLYSRGHWANGSGMLRVEPGKVERRKNAEVVNDPEAWHSMVVRGDRGALHFFYDGVLVGQVPIKSTGRTIPPFHGGFGSFETDVSLKEMKLESGR